MAKIDHIESISDKLAESTIAVLPKRCSYIRNWNSKCNACLNACPHDAIDRSLGHLEIKSDACTNCGACVTACPTSTFITTAPGASEIVKEARLSAQSNSGHSVFACAQLLEHQSIDTSKVAVLPCLDYLDEYLLTGLFALGIKSATLLQGSCETCTVNSDSPCIAETVRCVKRLLKLWNVDAHVRLTEKIPSQVRMTRGATHGLIQGQSRRNSFRQAGGSVLGYVAQAVNDTMEDLSGTKQNTKVRKQIVVRLDEVFPPDTYRSVRMLNMLDHVGTRPYGQHVDTRFWADVHIDPSKCRYCGMCANMCVTRALKFEKDEEDIGTLTFQPSLCINCRLCKDTCFTHSMVYSTNVFADDLDANVAHTLFVHKDATKRNRFFD